MAGRLKEIMTHLTGIYPALITPMSEDGATVNLDAMRALTRWHLARKVSGFFVCGGSGEGILMRPEERRDTLEVVLEECRGTGARVIAHVGAHVTAAARELAAHAEAAGAHAIAAVPPFYFRTDAQGLRDHYRVIGSGAPNTPLLVYNIPGNTGVEVTAAVVADLLSVPTVAGIKYSSYNLYDLFNITRLREDLSVLNGFDEVLVAGLTMGAHGGIGSTYNIMPAAFVALYRAYRAGDLETARRFQFRINGVVKALLGQPFFATLKAVLSAWGIPCGAPRQPNRAMSAEERAKAVAAVLASGVEQLEKDALAALKTLPAAA